MTSYKISYCKKLFIYILIEVIIEEVNINCKLIFSDYTYIYAVKREEDKSINVKKKVTSKSGIYINKHVHKVMLQFFYIFES